MEKNEILKSILDDYNKQKSDLLYEYRNINYNETNCNEKKFSLEMQISNISMDIQNIIFQLN
jgi:hypothetical protein